MTSAVDALKKISDNGATFMSRGDDSGTDKTGEEPVEEGGS